MKLVELTRHWEESNGSYEDWSCQRTAEVSEGQGLLPGGVLAPTDPCESERLSDALSILKPTAQRNLMDPKQ